MDAADANDNGDLTSADSAFIFIYLSEEIRDLPTPGAEKCGADSMDDNLGCQDYPDDICGMDGYDELLPEPFFRRGDANDDGQYNIADAIATLGCQFLGSLCPDCMESGDASDDGEFNVADPIFMLNGLFNRGRLPSAPGLDCGPDPYPESGLGCLENTSCVHYKNLGHDATNLQRSGAKR